MHSILLFCNTDAPQVQCFQSRVHLNSAPTALLLDCSEMELARNLGGRRVGRLDDNKDAVSRRLQVYREITLPMLKSLDEENRLRVVDGDREEVKVNTTVHFAHVSFSKAAINLIAKIES